MSDLLFTCPHCGRAGFTERGLRGHVCRVFATPTRLTSDEIEAIVDGQTPRGNPFLPSPPLATKTSMPKTTHALTVLAAPELRVSGKEDLAKLQADAGALCQAIEQSERKTALGAILAGLWLHRVKASMPHGKFGDFISQKLPKVTSWTPATAKKNASFYMRLCLVAAEKGKLTQQDLAALSCDSATLAIAEDATAKSPAAKLQKFVGDLSLTELLIKHGIKGVGLKTTLTTEEENEDADTPTNTGDQTWQEAWNSIQQIRETFTDPNRFSLITDPKKLDTLKEQLVEAERALDDRISALRATPV